MSHSSRASSSCSSTASARRASGDWSRGVLAPRALAAHRSHRLEDAPEAGSHATNVIRVTRGIGPHPFTAAPRETDFKDRCAAKSKCAAQAEAGFQSLEAEVAWFPAHLAELSEHAHPQGVQDPALVADLVCHEIGIPEAIITIAPQQVLIVDVRATQCRLKIEGHPVP